MTAEDLQQLQALFQIGHHNPITLRAIKKPNTLCGIKRPHVINLNFSATGFASIGDRWAAFALEAERLNATGYNIYTCLNPIRADFSGKAVADDDIACRKLLLVDLDRAGDTSAPATDDEIRKANEVADRIEDWVCNRVGEAPTRMLSGNGIHLYLSLADMPNDERSRAICRSVLDDLATQFNTADIKVDQSVHNASRITKVLGTWAYKGEQTDERPYRKAVLL